MTSMRVMGSIVTLAAGIALAAPIAAQKTTPADAATRLTGTWKLNRELSPGFRAPGSRPGGPG